MGSFCPRTWSSSNDKTEIVQNFCMLHFSHLLLLLLKEIQLSFPYAPHWIFCLGFFCLFLRNQCVIAGESGGTQHWAVCLHTYLILKIKKHTWKKTDCAVWQHWRFLKTEQWEGKWQLFSSFLVIWEKVHTWPQHDVSTDLQTELTLVANPSLDNSITQEKQTNRLFWQKERLKRYDLVRQNIFYQLQKSKFHINQNAKNHQLIVFPEVYFTLHYG